MVPYKGMYTPYLLEDAATGIRTLRDVEAMAQADLLLQADPQSVWDGTDAYSVSVHEALAILRQAESAQAQAQEEASREMGEAQQAGYLPTLERWEDALGRATLRVSPWRRQERA